MHGTIMVVGVVMTLLLAAPAARGGLRRAWLLAALSVVPTFLLYMAFRADGNERAYLFPVAVMAAIITWKACRHLVSMVAATPAAAINTTDAPNGEHWATT